MAGMDTLSLLEILQAQFGHVVSSESDEEENVLVEEKTSKVVGEIIAKPEEVDNLATAELAFPFKSSPLVVAGIPEMYLALCGPETLSCYHCQVPSYTLDFAQKAAASNHVCHDHQHVALACLYCSFESNPKRHWYSASAWEHLSMKHLKDSLPIYPDDPTFPQQFMCASSDDVVPSTSQQSLLHEEEVRKWAQAANSSLRKNKTPVKSPL